MGRRKKGDPVNGWLVLDKPVGPTSTDMVGKTRWLLNARKAGHAGTLDPLASYFFAFGGSDEDPKPVYTPQYADLWQDTTGKAPSYYGQDGEDVADLGQQIANDPRFAACATRRVYEGLMGRPTTAADQTALNQHTQAFKDGGLTLRALFRSVMSDPLYRGQDDGQRPTVERKLMSPEILSDAVAALTGHRLTIEGIDFLRSDNILHTLGGGLSAQSGDFPPTTSNVTRTLVQARVAEAAAWAQIDNEESTEALFGEIDLEDDTPDMDGFVRLHRVVLGMKLDEDASEIAEAVALWHDLVEKADLEPREAWAGVLTALLRDPRFVMY